MWGTRFSDDVSHILFGTDHGRCARAMARGLEIRVLEDDKTLSIADSGCENCGDSILCHTVPTLF